MDATVHQRADPMSPARSMRSALLTAGLTGVIFVSSTAPVQAAEFDLDHLPTLDATTLASSITTWTLDGSIVDLAKTKHESGQTVVTLDADILFDFAKATLPSAAPARIAAAVAKAPKGAPVSIGGHTDNVGTDADNLKLSQARAQAVAAAVKAARPDLVITVKGFGESRPVASNSDDKGRSENRRVEIRFLS